jgi:hypothetical protein
MTMRLYEYTWMWETKEGVVKTYEFFLDVVKSLTPRVGNGEFTWVGVCAGPKLCAGVKPGVDPLYALELTGLTPHDVTLEPDAPTPSILPVLDTMLAECGFRTQRYRPVLAGVDIGSFRRDWSVLIRGCSIGFLAQRRAGGYHNEQPLHRLLDVWRRRLLRDATRPPLRRLAGGQDRGEPTV